jgi:predicted transcriptional regulator|tara:strand:+ start:4063 stop:4392 length:330 start_codon:yes stop_codon:yes gene_type:complete
MASTDIFLRKKPVLFLLLLLSGNADETKTQHWLMWKTKTTNSHVHKVINKYVDAGMVAREKRGRVQMLSLTKKGKGIAEEMSLIWNKLGGEQFLIVCYEAKKVIKEELK